MRILDEMDWMFESMVHMIYIRCLFWSHHEIVVKLFGLLSRWWAYNTEDKRQTSYTDSNKLQKRNLLLVTVLETNQV
jgi:hypothetical protein